MFSIYFRSRISELTFIFEFFPYKGCQRDLGDSYVNMTGVNQISTVDVI